MQSWAFQSPPHRGTVCNSTAGSTSKAPAGNFQSPPHRGTVCNLRKGDSFGSSSVTFQSPPHRGTVCNRNPSKGTVVLVRDFQSPPHRGTVCNSAEVFRKNGKWYVLSVPSSSGNGLQLSRQPLAAGPSPAFSPLLIGERSATPIIDNEPQLPVTAFSPLLIGERSATKVRPFRLHRNGSPFSPLLIGERSATVEDPRYRGGRFLLSVPSSSGNGLQLQGFWRMPMPGLPLSVPSSSGNGLQLEAVAVADNGNRRAFSPLLIGERSATATNYQGDWPRSSHQPTTIFRNRQVC